MSFSLRADDVAEFNRLCEALPGAIARASDVLRVSFSGSSGHKAADAEVSQILASITRLTNELK
jgi:hypothetical protein